ncbi:MAG: DNA mismatch repair protein MutS, partial [Rhodospirillales bacterium]
MSRLSAEGASPAMAQWFALKEQHPDALLFFRMGDFFEMFFADAEAASGALDIALTQRGEHGGAPIPMCGVPVATAELYLARLIRRGFRVAVAEQMEAASARAGKAPLKRDVVRLITPGTLTEDTLLEAGRPSLLLALAETGDAMGAAWLDVSTGLFETAPVAAGGLPALLGRLDPAEILAPEAAVLGDFSGRRAPSMAAPPPLAARRRLAEAFGVASLDAFGVFSDAEAAAGALAVDYLRLTQAGKLPRLSHPVPMGFAAQMEMDAATRASLEIVRTRDGGAELTLFASVNRTATAPGARMLAAWIAAPLTDTGAIAARQDGWVWLRAAADRLASLRQALRGAPDMARALARICVGRGSPRDLAAIRLGLGAAEAAAGALAGELPGLLAGAVRALGAAPALAELLRRGLAEAVPIRLDDGGVIAEKFDAELDAYRKLRDDSRRVIGQMQLDFCQAFGVASLKIKHHAQLGYVIEAPAVAVEALRAFPALTLRQGMANGARFSHPDLADLDRRISEAADRAAAREKLVFGTLIDAVAAEAAALAAAAEALALLDVLQSCARLAEGGHWCRPDVEPGEAFCVVAGRHPVVEAAIAGAGTFVPNDCDLSAERRVLLLTGPNMAGKSTFLRQNALIAILAQAGLPAPAGSVRMGVVDRLFSRVGAADELARGRSTFMVEMTETAAILHQAGPRSLVIVDEIGRGTATLDGLAIAWAVLEALHSQLRCRTIFATHFHELAQLSSALPRLSPHMMRVREWRGEVVFLHEVAAGAGGRSWGVHVARLAGVPAPVVRRAAGLLSALEKGREPVIADLPLFASLPVPAAASCAVCEALEGVDPDGLSGREALALVYRLKGLVRTEEG